MAELIPRRVLFGNPERVSPRISPNGTSLAWIAPHNEVLNVWTAPVGPDGVDWDSAQVVTNDTDRGIRVFRWAHDGRHLLYLQDTGATPAELDTLLRLTERYCVVYQTLARPAQLTASLARGT